MSIFNYFTPEAHCKRLLERKAGIYFKIKRVYMALLLKAIKKYPVGAYIKGSKESHKITGEPYLDPTPTMYNIKVYTESGVVNLYKDFKWVQVEKREK